MELKRIRGLEGAQELLTRPDPLDFSGLPDSVTAQTRRVFGDGVTPEESVIRILRDVRNNGDVAVRHYSKLLDDVDLDDLRVSPAQMSEARAAVPDDLREALELAAQRVRQFHQAVLPTDWMDRESGLGELVRPLDRGGLYAPGGTPAYPSTVLMTPVVISTRRMRLLFDSAMKMLPEASAATP